MQVALGDFSSLIGAVPVIICMRWFIDGVKKANKDAVDSATGTLDAKITLGNQTTATAIAEMRGDIKEVRVIAERADKNAERSVDAHLTCQQRLDELYLRRDEVDPKVIRPRCRKEGGDHGVA